jgi:peptide-methionine (R)-S-oxide reductase
MAEIERTDAQWRDILSPERYAVLRQAGTERPWTGALLKNHDDGTYTCGACGAELFDSTTKFESGSGWPSFFEPKVADAVELVGDRAHGMVRVEVRCRRCGSHLGHVFPDGPAPTGARYCMNSLSLDFVAADADADADAPADTAAAAGAAQSATADAAETVDAD